MKLSDHTIEVLKNFATINQNLVIKEGSTLSTMSAMKNIVAKADVEEPSHPVGWHDDVKEEPEKIIVDDQEECEACAI